MTRKGTSGRLIGGRPSSVFCIIIPWLATRSGDKCNQFYRANAFLLTHLLTILGPSLAPTTFNTDTAELNQCSRILAVI